MDCLREEDVLVQEVAPLAVVIAALRAFKVRSAEIYIVGYASDVLQLAIVGNSDSQHIVHVDYSLAARIADECVCAIALQVNVSILSLQCLYAALYGIVERIIALECIVDGFHQGRLLLRLTLRLVLLLLLPFHFLVPSRK